LTCEPQSDCRLPSAPELWSGPSRLPALASLDLSSTQVASLADMPVLPALETIDLQGSDVTDLSPLKGRNPMPEVLVDDQALLNALR
jgi:Leucine-rich repeat (LRR) protein